MHSERMMMPKWAKAAATRLSDEQVSFSHDRGGDAYSHPPCDPPGLSEDDLQHDSGIAKSLETVGGTVSRKGKFGFVCEKCHFVPEKSSKPDWVSWEIGWNNRKSVGLHFPERCRRCKSRMKRWTCAARNYDRLELLRLLEGRHCLRFLTFTKEEWNIKIPSGMQPWLHAEELKKLRS